MRFACEDIWPRWAKWSYDWTGFYMYGRMDGYDDEEAEGYWRDWRDSDGAIDDAGCRKGGRPPWQVHPEWFIDPSTWCAASRVPNCSAP